MKMQAYTLAGWLAIGAAASAQWPPAEGETPANDPVIRVPMLESVPAKPAVVQVSAADAPVQGPAAFAKALAESKAAYAKTRDYIGHMVRQERVNGTLQPEQTAEIRVRTEPFAIHVKVVAPKAASGWETAYAAGRKSEYIRFRAAGTLDMRSLKPDDPKATAGTRHAITNVGIGAILSRVEKIVETERKLRNPVQIVAADYKFEGKPCLRFEIFCEKPHAQRYAHRAVLYVDSETKLPVRWEAYDGPKPGDPAGELLESISFVNLKFNTGLGDSTFDK
jgi:hypothetical protein